MNEKDALKKFYECANNNDLAGCLESLKDISIDDISIALSNVSFQKKISPFKSQSS